MKFQRQLQKLVTNKYVLYITFFIALTNMIGYLTVENYDSLTFFILVGVLSSFFSKNMTINLLTAITATNILYASTRVQEGMKAMTKNIENEHVHEAASHAASLREKEEEEKREKAAQQKVAAATKKKEGYAKKKKKGIKSEPAPATEEEEDEAIGARIDYAATLEGAYDNLQKMLGGDGMKGLTKETAALVKQQKGLMDNLNQMGPVLKTAKETLEMLSSQSGGMAKLTGMLAQLTGGKKK